VNQKELAYYSHLYRLVNLVRPAFPLSYDLSCAHAPYFGLYVKTHRQYHYERLNEIRLRGNWEAWFDFFAETVIVTATQAVDTARQIVDLANQDRDRISGLTSRKRNRVSVTQDIWKS
jgi:Fic family protein